MNMNYGLNNGHSLLSGNGLNGSLTTSAATNSMLTPHPSLTASSGSSSLLHPMLPHSLDSSVDLVNSLTSATPAQTSAHQLHLQAHQTAMAALNAQQTQNNPSHTTTGSGALNHLALPSPTIHFGPITPATPIKAIMATVPNSGASTTAGTPNPNHHSPSFSKSFSQSNTSPGNATNALTFNPLGIVGMGMALGSNNGSNGNGGVLNHNSPPGQHQPSLSAHTSPSQSHLTPNNSAPNSSRRPSPAAALDGKTIVMATVLDSKTNANSVTPSRSTLHPPPSFNSTGHATRRSTSPLALQKQSQVVTATVLDESSLRAHPNAARPATAHAGQKVISATIIPASSVRATAVMAATPAKQPNRSTPSSSSSSSSRNRKRSHKAGGGGGASRAKLTNPDPLDDVDDGSITRCICGSTEDDGFMICCEGCSAWQHGECIGVDPDHVPEEYYCDLCDPEGELHQARLAAADAASSESKRKRRKRGNMSLGKKKGRRQSNSRNMDYSSDGSMSDGDSYSSRSGSASRSGSDMEDVDEPAPSTSKADVDDDYEEGNGSTRHRSRAARALKPLHVSDKRSSVSSSSSSQNPPPLETPSPASAAFQSPTFSPTSTGGSSSNNTILSPGGSSMIISTTASGQIAPGGETPTPGQTPQMSPTGETKLRSLIFTMEQLTNGQLTSPISTSASMSLAKFRYPGGETPPGFQPSSRASPPNGDGGAASIPSPLTLHRQVSENTANAAMTVAGISTQPTHPHPLSTNSTNASTASVATKSHVKLEIFSPVLPPSMISVPQSDSFTYIPIASSEDTLAYRAHRAAQQQLQQQQSLVKSESMVAASGSMTGGPAPIATPATAPDAFTTPSIRPSNPNDLIGLLSPNTHAAVVSLTSVHHLPTMMPLAGGDQRTMSQESNSTAAAAAAAAGSSETASGIISPTR